MGASRCQGPDHVRSAMIDLVHHLVDRAIAKLKPFISGSAQNVQPWWRKREVCTHVSTWRCASRVHSAAWEASHRMNLPGPRSSAKAALLKIVEYVQNLQVLL